MPLPIRVRLARRRNNDKDSSAELYTSTTYVLMTTFENLQIQNVEPNNDYN